MPVAEKHLANLYDAGKRVPVDKNMADYWRARAAADSDKGPGSWTEL